MSPKEPYGHPPEETPVKHRPQYIVKDAGKDRR